MKNDALYAYLEFCHAIKEVPDQKVYQMIYDCNDTSFLDTVAEFMERQHSNYEKELKIELEKLNKKPSKKWSFKNIFK
ncbi:hypothetical protein [Chryseobacterium sp. MEBOG07]|uniref:hypothetical protein n=1 Tax=Chryseobacterium sp. MEBOG07 TaxID=2879939 RepID=UPI001F224C6A|nr:hypothetical protein [Chryseobacterium sp. MEBOG07]UKB81277.1 hypothetical protein LF886_09880 [Chryseobacterium sp. MEBOG07]